MLGIFLISLISSIVLALVPIEQACGIDQEGCYKVQTSEYEKTLGINNGYWGIVAFTVLSILAIMLLKNPNGKKRFRTRFLLNFGVFVSFIFSIYFLYLQIFAINAFCKYCVAIDAGAIINMGMVLIWRKK